MPNRKRSQVVLAGFFIVPTAARRIYFAKPAFRLTNCLPASSACAHHCSNPTSAALTVATFRATKPALCPQSTHPLIERLGENVGGISERAKEIKRRRHRRKKLTVFSRKLKKATVSEKQVLAEKIRNLTPGAETIIQNWGLAASDR